MEKYEYRAKTEEMLEYMGQKLYDKALQTANSIDWHKVKNAGALCAASEVYEYHQEYRRSREILFLAYDRSPSSRKIVYRLGTLALKMGDVREATDCYEEFIAMAPKDPNQYILRYKILKTQKAPLTQQIEALEDFKRVEYVEKWAFELAKLYHEAGMVAECLEECDDLILWFSEGTYVYMAMELKMQYKPLTPLQQEKYIHRNDSKEEKKKEQETKTEETAAEEAVAEETAAAAETEVEAASEEPEGTVEEAAAEEVVAEETAAAAEAEVEAESEEPEAKAEEAAAEEVVAAEVTAAAEAEVEAESEDEEPEAAVEEAAVEEAAAEEVAAKETPAAAEAEVEVASEEPEAKAEETAVEEAAVEEATAAAEAEVEAASEKPEAKAEETAVEEVVAEKTAAAAEAEVEAESEEPEAKAEEAAAEEVVAAEVTVEETPAAAEAEVETASEEPKVAVEAASEEPEAKAEEAVAEEVVAEEILAAAEETAAAAEAEGKAASEEPEAKAESAAAEEVVAEETVAEKTAAAAETEVEAASEESEAKAEETAVEEAAVEETAAAAEVEVEAESEELEIPEESVAEDAAKEELEITKEFVIEKEAEEAAEEQPTETAEEENVVKESAEPVKEEYTEEIAEQNTKMSMEEILQNWEEKKKENAQLIQEEQAKAKLEKKRMELERQEEEESLLPDDIRQLMQELEDESVEIQTNKTQSEVLETESVPQAVLPEETLASAPMPEMEFDEEPEEEQEQFYGEHEFEDVDSENFEEIEEIEEYEDGEDSGIKLGDTQAIAVLAKALMNDKEVEGPAEAPIEKRVSDNPFDTGFIVQGRYDLEAQSEIGLKAGLTEEQKKLFSYFVPVHGMSEQIVDVLEHDRKCKTRYGTSRTANLLIVGRKGSGKTVLAVDIVKAIQKTRRLKQGKVGIVTAESLNKKDVASILEKLHGGALIIERASKMNRKTIAQLNDLMEEQTGELLVVLEEERRPLDKMLAANPAFKKKFTSRLELPVFINDELVTFGQTYAKENGYKIDEMGILALYSRIDMMQREEKAVTVADVKEIVDSAIERSQKMTFRRFLKKLFGRKKEQTERIVLQEQDFK